MRTCLDCRWCDRANGIPMQWQQAGRTVTSTDPCTNTDAAVESWAKAIAPFKDGPVDVAHCPGFEQKDLALLNLCKAHFPNLSWIGQWGEGGQCCHAEASNLEVIAWKSEKGAMCEIGSAQSKYRGGIILWRSRNERGVSAKEALAGARKFMDGLVEDWRNGDGSI